MTDLTRVWPPAGADDVKVFYWPSGTGVAFTQAMKWDLQVSWKLPLKNDDVLTWTFHEYGEEDKPETEKRMRGSNLRWRDDGRIIAAGENASDLFVLLSEKGIPFTDVEKAVEQASRADRILEEDDMRQLRNPLGAPPRDPSKD